MVDANSVEDNEKVTAIQNKIQTKQKSIGQFDIPQWDTVSLKKTRSYILGLAKDMPDSKHMFGDKDEVDPIRHLIGTAAGFGGTSEKDATYLNFNPKNNDGIASYVLNIPKDVSVDGFWWGFETNQLYSHFKRLELCGSPISSTS